MKPFLVGQTVHIPVPKLERMTEVSKAIVSPEHLSEAAVRTEIERKNRAQNPFCTPEALARVTGIAIIDSVYAVTKEDARFFFYKLRDSALLWPQAALDLESRLITVNKRKPLEPRFPRNSLWTSFRLPDGDAGLYVGGMPYAMSEVGILRLFTPFGDVESVDIRMDRMTGRSRGFGFVNFRDVAAEDEAIASLNGIPVTADGDTDNRPSEELESWLRRSWEVEPADFTEFEDEVQTAARLVEIVKDASRALAELVANCPMAIMQIEWRDFERMLAAVFEGLGFVVVCGRGSKDEGIDLVLSTKTATFVVQAKHWTSGKKVGGSILNATISVALSKGFDAGIVLSTSGFARNAATAVTTVERKLLRIGGRSEVHSICKTYVGASQGLFLPLDPDALVRTHTRGISEKP